jgi:NitT/TauT family transport system permease protein
MENPSSSRIKEIYERSSRVVLVFFTLLFSVLAWHLISAFSNLPSFIFPAPGQVWMRFIKTIQDGSLLYHTGVTLLEVLLGLTLGVSSAILLGYIIAKSATVERILSPYIVASQSIPIVAIAPLMVIWFGPSLLSKVLISALIVFFPVLVNTIVGVRSVPKEFYELMRSLQATPWQLFTKLEIPAAMPVFLGGLRIGATLAVIGAVVGEFVGSDQGLGFLINVGRGMYDTALVFVAVFTLILLALTLYGVVVQLEKYALSWKNNHS